MVEAAEEVAVQLGRRSPFGESCCRGGGGGLGMRVAIEVEVQLGSGSSCSGGGGGSSSRGGKSHTIKPVVILVEGIGSVHITFHRLRVFQFSSKYLFELLLNTPLLFIIPILEHPLLLVQEVFDVTGDTRFIMRIASYSPHWNPSVSTGRSL